MYTNQEDKSIIQSFFYANTKKLVLLFVPYIYPKTFIPPSAPQRLPLSVCIVLSQLFLIPYLTILLLFLPYLQFMVGNFMVGITMHF